MSGDLRDVARGRVVKGTSPDRSDGPAVAYVLGPWPGRLGPLYDVGNDLCALRRGAVSDLTPDRRERIAAHHRDQRAAVRALRLRGLRAVYVAPGVYRVAPGPGR